MSPDPFDESSWNRIRDDVYRLLRDDEPRGVLRWLESCARALLRGDVDTCSRLLSEPFALPAKVADATADRLQRGVDALRAGKTGDLIESLSFGSVEARRTLDAFFKDGAIGTEGTNDFETACAYGLAAAWLEASGTPTEAAAAYYEAGTRLSWQDERQIRRAADVLTRAHELAPRHVPTCWHLANTLLRLSFLPDRPYADRTMVERSLEVWERGAALQYPDPSTSWAYVTRSLICEQLANLDEAGRVALWWEGITYLECAVLLDPAEAGRWTSLGRLHRTLENDATAIHATRKALEQDAQDTGALDERAVILTNVGAFEEAAAIIDQRLAQDATNFWAMGIKAFILAEQKEYEAGLSLIDQVIAAEPGGLWNLGVRAICRWRSGDRDGALETYREIWKAFTTANPLDNDDRRLCAIAAYRLGDLDSAAAILEELSRDPFDLGETLRALGACHLAKGDISRGEEMLLGGIARATAWFELDEFLSVEVPELEAVASREGGTPGSLASINRVKRTGRALLSELRRPAVEDVRAAAEAELVSVRQSLQRSDETSARTAVLASLARLQLQGERWRDAAASYRALGACNPPFPEAARGIEQTVSGLRAAARKSAAASPADSVDSFRLLLHIDAELSNAAALSSDHEEFGDTLWKSRSDAGALQHFRDALEAADEASPDRRAALHSRIAIALHVPGGLSDAHAHYLDALRLFREADTRAPGEALADACRPMIRDVEHFWAVDALWKTFEEDATWDPVDRADLSAARLSLISYLDAVFRLSEYDDKELVGPLVIPIALEVGSDLVPHVDPKSDGGKFILEDIPAMRSRIENSSGLPVPGIRVRGTVGTTDAYVILLDEIPVARGSVRIGHKYCGASGATLEAIGVTGDGVEQAIDPATGRHGSWCSSKYWDQLEQHGIALQTETKFVLSHVERLIRSHLDTFAGVQDVDQVMRKAPQYEEFASSILGDAIRKLAFFRLLRALVREGVPITDLSAIMAVVREHGLSTVRAALSTTRLRLKPFLPGNQESATHVQAPDEWESVLGNLDDLERLAVSPAAAHRLLVTIRMLMEPQDMPVALTTKTATLQPFVKRLVEFELPRVDVLSKDEAVDRRTGTVGVVSEPLGAASAGDLT